MHHDLSPTRSRWPAARRGARPLLLALLLASAIPAAAWEMSGRKNVRLHGRDGQPTTIGSVEFTPAADGRTRFVLKMDTERLKDYFLSMREFKCVDGQTEVLCHVPYPYPNPASVTSGDLAWLEHALMFMFKKPSEFGAKLWNGVYFQLSATPQGLEGKPQAVDLNLIGAPPDRPDVPPFRPALRDDYRPDARWFNRLSIE